MGVETGQRTILEQLEGDYKFNKLYRFYEWSLRQGEQNRVFTPSASIDDLSSYVERYPQEVLVYKGEVDAGYDRRVIRACFERGKFYATYSDIYPKSQEAAPRQVSYKQVECDRRASSTINLHILPYKEQAILEFGNMLDQKMLQAWYSNGVLRYISCVAGQFEKVAGASSEPGLNYKPIKDCEECHGPYQIGSNEASKDYIKLFRWEDKWYAGSYSGSSPLSFSQHINNSDEGQTMRLLSSGNGICDNVVWKHDDRSFSLKKYVDREGVTSLAVGFSLPNRLDVQKIFSILDARNNASDWSKVGEYLGRPTFYVPDMSSFTK